MGCSEDTNVDMEKVDIKEIQKNEKEGIKKSKNIENQDKERVNKEDDEENKEKEKVSKADDEKNKEKKEDGDDDYIQFLWDIAPDEEFSFCQKLASKEYDKDTIIFYKNHIYIKEDENAYHECFVIKTMKKEGLPYENKDFEFKSPWMFSSMYPNIKSFIFKSSIIEGRTYGPESEKPKFKDLGGFDCAQYKIEIKQKPDEPFVIYTIYSIVKRENLTGANSLFNAVSFNKNNLSNPECHIDIYITYENYDFNGSSDISNYEFINKKTIMKLSGGKEGKEEIQFFFRLKNPPKIILSKNESPFKFYNSKSFKHINNAINAIDLKPGVVIAVSEMIKIRKKICTVTLTKTLIRPNVSFTSFTAADMHFVKETKNLKVALRLANHKPLGGLQFDGKDYFTLPYSVEPNEAFASVQAIFMYRISTTQYDMDIIELVSGKLCEYGVYYLTIDYDPNEYETVNLMRDLRFTECDEPGTKIYCDYYEPSIISDEDVFNKILLLNKRKE